MKITKEEEVGIHSLIHSVSRVEKHVKVPG
jgi:hypothetical protein